MKSIYTLAFCALAVCFFASGCNGSPSTKVMNGEVPKDASLGSEYSGETGGDPLAAEPKQPAAGN